MKKDGKEKEKANYEQGLKKTMIPLIFGIIAGIICFTIFISNPYLVCDNGVAKQNMDNGTVPDNLFNQFEIKGTPLAENATIENKGTGKWLLTDEENNSTYIIKENAGKLSIYASPVSSDWLLIAILIVMIQKFAYPRLHMEIEGAKDWLYIGFMTISCWFLTFTLLLSLVF